MVTQLIRLQVSSESLDYKLQNVTDNMEMKIASEMVTLKQSLLKEIMEVKTEIACISSREKQNNNILSVIEQQTRSATSSQTDSHSVSTGTENRCDESLSSATVNGTNNNNKKQYTAFIAGDSITKKVKLSQDV